MAASALQIYGPLARPFSLRSWNRCFIARVDARLIKGMTAGRRGGNHMRLYSMTLATAALALGTATSAAAMTTGTPTGLRAAIEDIANVETVHCVPGWVHWHRWGWGTGCYGGFYRPRVYGYGFYGGPRFYGFYGGPRRFYGYRRW
jgi:hypothetical protein